LKQKKLDDSLHRQINYLRVSITDRCNLNCIYCRPDSEIPKLNHGDILRYEEIHRIIRVAADLGVSKVRITGGEPLVRKGVIEFIHSLKTLTKIQDVSLTTNGINLSEHLSGLRQTPVGRLNISLDSLKRERFMAITGFDGFDKLWNAILHAHASGFNPIKINVVALRGINEDELADFANLTFRYPFHIRFIEHMPIGHSKLEWKKPMLSPEIKDRISSAGELVPVPSKTRDGPADRYRIQGAMGEIGLISPVSHHFCKTCNRLRLTASGHLKPCLLNPFSEDLKTPLRSGCTDEELAEIMLGVVAKKPSGHNLSDGACAPLNMQMSSIGG
jgi:cyclic pyranopterin phosphate synthase